MVERAPDGDGFRGFLPLRVACARVYLAVTGHAAHDNGQWHTHLDSVAFSLCMVARIHATDPLTQQLFPVSASELIRGRFQNGGESFVLDGEAKYAGLHIAAADLEDAIRLLTSARSARPSDPPPTRP